MEKSGEQPPPPQQQGEPKRGAEEISLDAPMPPIFGNANQSEGDVFKVCPRMSPGSLHHHAQKVFPEPLRTLKFESCVLCT